MPRRKPPSVNFYYEDWAYGTSKLPRELKGDYITILCEIWDSPDYAIDFDVKRLRVVLGCRAVEN